MFLKLKYPSLYIVYYLTITCCLVYADDIPTMLWNIKGNSLHIKSVSALGRNDKYFSESLKDVLPKASILVFAVNKLSLEDFSVNDKPSTLNNTLHNIESFLDAQPHMLLPSVKDPLNYIHKAHCGVQEIVVDNKIDDIVMQAVSTAIQRSCVVILHVSDDGIITNEGQLKTVFLPTFEKLNKNVVGIFTGVKSSWGAPDNDHHILRNLLQIDFDEDKNFVNITGCLIMYAENATIKLGKEDNDTIPLMFPPETDGSVCGNTSILNLNFKAIGGGLESVSIKLNFIKYRGFWKTVGNISMIGTKATFDDELELQSEFVEAPLGFSYSCGKAVFKPKNRTFPVSVIIHAFQIQPYEVRDAFSDSFDCTPFFTIPIWMGIFVSILCIMILNIGIYALFSVNTMDRFDDPKGKTISVATTAD